MNGSAFARGIATLACFFMITACATPAKSPLSQTQKKEAALQFEKKSIADKATIISGPELVNELDQDFVEMRRICEEKTTGRANAILSMTAVSLLLPIIGAVAGAIAIPALTAANTGKEWIAALGGVSGVTNIAQSGITKESDEAKASYNERVHRLDEALKDYTTAISRVTRTEEDVLSKYYASKAAIQRAVLACTMPVAVSTSVKAQAPAGSTPSAEAPSKNKEGNTEGKKEGS
ncbi:MAG: hypothetical protein H8K05_19565 [Nitrospira sp.]|nr:hypothetical protein [Nitrospira sp.]